MTAIDAPPPCDICGAPSTTLDGIVGMALCDHLGCLDAAYWASPEQGGADHE